MESCRMASASGLPGSQAADPRHDRTISEFEQGQLKAIREELDRTHALGRP